MAARVKLCAIAKNEGPYLADWVFHHLHFGFAGVEVWVNDTDDGSLRILNRIGDRHPQVSGRKVDRLLEECVASGEVFQHKAYARLAPKARREGYSHVAFLDLDEYWTPKDFVTGIQAFVPDDPEVSVVSFQWALDVPDPGREPFASPYAGEVRLQLDRHVKSLARLDDSVKRYRTHTAGTRRGVTLLVREPFPIVDRRAQVGGSLLPEEHLVERWSTLPEAFVLHAVHRSPVEYVASLTKGLRQMGLGDEVKTNRRGYVTTEAPVLDLTLPVAARRGYEARRGEFRGGLDIDRLVRGAQRKAVARAEGLLAAVAADEALAGQLRGPLGGLPPSLVAGGVRAP